MNEPVLQIAQGLAIPNIEKNIFNSLHSVCIETFPGYKAGGEPHSFLEDYEDRLPQKG